MVATPEKLTTEFYIPEKDGTQKEKDWDDFLPDETLDEAATEVTYEDKDSDIDIPEDPYKVRTKRTFVNNPYNKAIIALGLVGTGVFLFMQLIRLITGGYVISQETSLSSAFDPQPEASSVFDSEPEIVNDDLRIHQALNEQSNEIKEVEQFNQKVAQTSEPVGQPSTPPTPTAQAPAPSPQPTPVRTVSYTPQAQPQPTPVSIKPKVEKKDPMEQWLLAANMGSYGATNLNDQQASYPNPDNYSSKQKPEKVVPVSYPLLKTPTQRETLSASKENKSYSSLSSDEFKRGTRVKGEIELPIIWMLEAGQYNQQRDYLIRLKSAMRGANGQEIVPKGSLAVVKAQQFFGSTGLIQLEVRSIIMEKNGQTQEYLVPANSLVVLDEDGGILSAKAEKASNVSREAGAFLLSGISRAASVMNSPNSTFYSSFGSSTTYGDGDVVSGFIKGATNSAVNSIQQRQARVRNRPQSQSTVYVIDGGTEVQLVVNKSFSLEP